MRKSRRNYSGPAAFAVPGLAVLVALGACDDRRDPETLAPAETIPELVEHVDANGNIVQLEQDESWDGTTYPVRIVRMNEEGQVVAESVLNAPPSVDALFDRMSDVQKEKVRRVLQDLADQHPESNAGKAQDILRRREAP